MRYRSRVLGLLSLLTVITYLDRVCISVAGPRMQSALGIGPVGWGWVTGVFTLSYAVFEIPSGILGDRIGARRVLTRIVLWWSAFTTVPGIVPGFRSLLATRFLFGVGEAGAFPNASLVVARWFPVHERGRAFGIILMAAQLGGALAPLLVVPIQMHYGWRASFYVFGLLGVVWSGVWYVWFRDAPAEKVGISAAELRELVEIPKASHHGLPWGIAFRTWNFWTVILICFCYMYTNTFYVSWIHTYLVKARGFREEDLLLSFLPFFLAAGANLLGGLVSEVLVRRLGLRWGRRSIGVTGLGVAGLCMAAALVTHSPVGTLTLLSLASAGTTFQQPMVYAVCLDIGGVYAGAMTGAMNTAAGASGFVSSLLFGYMVRRFGSYDLPLVPMAALLLCGAMLWLRMDAERPLLPVEMVGSVPEAVILEG